jgi:hypothetical protein
MRYTPPTLPCPCSIDSKLIAAVQANAGAQCHEAANLVQAYLLSADLYQDALHKERAACDFHDDTELHLRKFLFERRSASRPCPTQTCN